MKQTIKNKNKTKTNKLDLAETWSVITALCQWEHKVKTSKLPRARENMSDQVATGFACESDWLRKWLDSSLLITERSKAKLKRSLNTFDTSLKLILSKKACYVLILPESSRLTITMLHKKLINTNVLSARGVIQQNRHLVINNSWNYKTTRINTRSK